MQERTFKCWKAVFDALNPERSAGNYGKHLNSTQESHLVNKFFQKGTGDTIIFCKKHLKEILDDWEAGTIRGYDQIMGRKPNV